jgi:glycosyltransferase involved in cell wall biosynthesis
MRVALNAQLYSHAADYRATGVSRYVEQLVSRLPRVAPEHEYEFFVPPRVQVPGGIASRLPTENPLTRIWWEQCIEPVHVRRHHIEVLHSPVNVSPLVSSAPSVVTLHDLSFVRFPDRFRGPQRRYQTMMSRISARRARFVIVPSVTTRDDAVSAFDLDPGRVVVIPEAVGDEFRVDRTSPRPLVEPYILFVGTMEPRKNIPLLIDAFAQFRARGGDHTLALVGPRGWMFEQVEDAIQRAQLGPSIRILDYVPDLTPWYNHAAFFVYPSAYEGFGLPPLEAMACGTPAVLSTAGSLAELAGDAALLVDPAKPMEMVAAMETLAADPTLRCRLTQAGLARAAEFSWDVTVRKTVAVYEAAVNRG